MSVWIAMLLGLVQGLCEFLPVSSSGHLVLLQNVFGVSEGALFFDTMLHVGTLVAVFCALYKEIWALLRHPIQKKVLYLIIATAVTALLAVIFKSFIEEAYEGALLGFGFILTFVILLLAEKLTKPHKGIDDMKWYEAAGVGLIQGIAIMPGVSRSGSTISGARFFGVTKEEAASFSFILSIPAILGSVVLQLPDVISEGLAGVSWANIFVGMAVAAVSGYFAIRFMLALVKKHSLIGFGIYCAVIGVLVLADQLLFNLFFANPFVG